MTKLLLALDGTHHAEELLSQVKILPSASELEVLLLHCLDLNSLGYPSGPHGYEQLLDSRKERCQAFLNREAGRLRELGYGRIKTEVIVGPPRQSILNVAQDEATDVIILQTHGRSGLQWLVLGSVAEGVIRRSPCPVVVLPADARGLESGVKELI